MPKNGFSLIELITVIAVGSILVIALVMFIGRAFNVSREQFEQVRITEDGRIQLERVSDTLRNARSLDCNDDGTPDRYWLRSASENEITVLTNVDDDEDPEEVQYVFADDEGVLRQRVRHANPSDRCNFPPGQDEEMTLVRTLKNAGQDPPRPFFQYFSGGSAPIELDPPSPLSNVVRVRINLLVDVNEQQYPPRAEIVTDVTPREVASCLGEACGSGGSGVAECSVTAGNFISSPYNYADNFADQAYGDCIAYCGNQSGGACCDYAVGFWWDGEYDGQVDGYCACQASGIPPGLPTQQIQPGQYTAFFKQCYEGQLCDGYVGEPYCEPTCLSGSALGSCACDCTP